MKNIIIETERVLLRDWQEEDIPVAIEMYADPQVMQYIGNGKPRNREEAIASVERYRKANVDVGFTYWVAEDKTTGDIIGHCGIKLLPEAGEDVYEIGWLLRQAYWGMGLATEMAAVVLKYGLKETFLKRIVAIAYPQNTQSIRIMEKIGMHFYKNWSYNGIPVIMYEASSP